MNQRINHPPIQAQRSSLLKMIIESKKPSTDLSEGHKQGIKRIVRQALINWIVDSVESDSFDIDTLEEWVSAYIEKNCKTA